MANTHIVYGKIKFGNSIDALSLQSLTIANNAVSANSNTSFNYCAITAIGGDVYVAFAPAAGTANAANTSARAFIPVGTTKEFGLAGSVKIHTLDA